MHSCLVIILYLGNWKQFSPHSPNKSPKLPLGDTPFPQIPHKNSNKT